MSAGGTTTIANLTVIALGVQGTLNVNGAVTLNAGLTVTGTTTLNGAVTVNTGPLTVNGAINCGTLAASSLFSGTTLTVTTNAAIGGILTVTGFGTHTFNAVGTGGNVLKVQNPAPGSGNYAEFSLGTDTSASLGAIQAYSSTFPAVAQALPNGVALISAGSGGLTLNAATAFVRFLTGSSTERMRIAPTGEVCINATTALNPGVQKFWVAAASPSTVGIGVQNTDPSNSLVFVAFYNSGGNVAGLIQQSGATTVTYGTSSDARLKDDGGRASDLSSLRAVVVHDFTWKADGVRDRGIFAQEAHALYPRAVTEGTDDLTESGELARPWMTDYSKFVADLIVGWQYLDAEVTALRADLRALKQVN
jgi:hypothetical protein